MQRTTCVRYIGVIGIAAVVTGSLVPDPPAFICANDRLLHFLAYFSLTLWYTTATSRRTALTSGALFAAMGASLELMQGLSDGRVCSAGDFALNCAGVFYAL